MGYARLLEQTHKYDFHRERKQEDKTQWKRKEAEINEQISLFPVRHERRWRAHRGEGINNPLHSKLTAQQETRKGMQELESERPREICSQNQKRIENRMDRRCSTVYGKTPMGRQREVETGVVDDQPMNCKAKETTEHTQLEGPVEETDEHAQPQGGFKEREEFSQLHGRRETRNRDGH